MLLHPVASHLSDLPLSDPRRGAAGHVDPRPSPGSRRPATEGTAAASGRPDAVPGGGLRVVAVAELGEDQREAVRSRARVVRVLGAPGTGKTTVAIHALLDRVRRDGVAADRVLLLAPTRVAAARLREAVTAAVGGTTTVPLARTPQSFAFSILAREAALAGEPAPRLLSGAEQDVILGDLLAGHAAGMPGRPRWPEEVAGAVATRGFRAELRDLLMRAVELGVAPGDLEALGASHGMPAWAGAAAVLREYDEVSALSRPGAFDPAWILGAPADRLATDADATARVVADVGAVVVDDAQELTPPAAGLLSALSHAGVDLVLVGDPDASTQTFRGADPRILAGGSAADERRHVLRRGRRQPPPLAAVTARVSARIGALAGTGHRLVTPAAPRPGPRVPAAEVHVLRGAAAEGRYVADRLRRARLLDGVRWDEMAVIVRGRARTDTLRRALAAARVPVDVPGARAPLREEQAVRPLLTLLQVVLAAERAEVRARVPSGGLGPAVLTEDEALDLLTSPLGGADALDVRRLRQALRRREVTTGGTRGGGVLLRGALLGEVDLADDPVAAPAAVIAGAVAAGRRAVRAGRTDPEELLWALWSGAGRAEQWRATALGGGTAGRRADRDLDAVVALFAAARAYADRLPGRDPGGFLRHVRDQVVAADSLVERAPAHDCVTLTTPQGAAGREWSLVVVAGVQDGVWPDLRLRGSLLGSERLVDIVTGRDGSVRGRLAATRHDETRLFLTAVSRARTSLIVTAASNEDEQPSPYLDLVDPREATDGDRPTTLPPPELGAAGVVGELRRRLLREGDGPRGRAAARHLARLAAAGVPGADPAHWWAIRRASDDRPRRSPERPVTVSPSRLQSFTECGLRWLLTSAGAESAHPAAPSAVGTLVHEVAAEAGGRGIAALEDALDERWPTLGLPDGWIGRRYRALAGDMLARLARHEAEASAAGWVVVGREVDASVDIGRARVRARVDRLERDRRGRLRVVDLKTGSRRPAAAELARLPQLGAYQAAVEHGAFGQARSSAGAALLQLGRAAPARGGLQKQRPLADDPEPGWARELLAEAADGMGGARFRARTGTWCRTCPARPSCPLQPEGASW